MEEQAKSPLEMLLKSFSPAELSATAEVVKDLDPGPAKAGSPWMPLGQFPAPKPEEENPGALFKRGWLRKGGGAFLIAPSGVGKSVLVTQAAMCWALGKPAFGVAPVRPLKVGVIQAEDDRQEVSEFRDCVRHGLVSEYGFDAGDLDFVLGVESAMSCRVFFKKCVGKIGEEFVQELEGSLNDCRDMDLVIVNPFQSYFGDDCSKNSALSLFLRVWIDSVIKDPRDEGNDRAAVLFVHHTNKPPNDKDMRAEWGSDMFAAYIGAGGAEIVNWARAILSLMPTAVPGTFRFIAGKRGQRLGWVDTNGKPVFCKVLKHAESGAIYWREGDEADLKALSDAAVAGGRKSRGGDGNGGVPPDQSKLTLATILSAIDAKEGMSGRKLQESVARDLNCGLTAVFNWLSRAVDGGYAVKNRKGLVCSYELTELGRKELETCPL